MLKRFTLWMEDQAAKKRLIHVFLDRLGYDKHTLDAGGDQIITDRKLSDIIATIKSMAGVSEENKKQMQDFVMSNNKSLSLKALTNLINPLEGEVQDKAYSKPAELPQASQPVPKPMNPQQMQQQQPQPPQMPGMQ